MFPCFAGVLHKPALLAAITYCRLALTRPTKGLTACADIAFCHAGSEAGDKGGLECHSSAYGENPSPSFLL